MPTYLHPGVYVEEVSGGARPIEAVGTSTAAFVGIAEKGPVDEPRFITNFTEFQQTFGGYVKDNNTIGVSYLAYSVFHFFQNGGKSCWVVRVEKDATFAACDLYTDEAKKTMTVKAISPGTWGNDLRIEIGPPTALDEGFSMYIYKKDEQVEPYDDLSMANDSPYYADKIINKRSVYIRVKSEDLPDNPTFISRKEIPATGYDLSKVKKIRLKIDSFDPYSISCVSDTFPDKSKVSGLEICKNINDVFKEKIDVPVAAVENNRIKITSPTATKDSVIEFTAPEDMDATEDIFGLVESSWEVKATNTNAIAVAYGMADLSSTAITLTNNIVFQHPSTGADLTAVDVKGTTIWDIVKVLNDATVAGGALVSLKPTGRSLAWTDGKHLILKTDKDIRIKRSSAVENAFGTGFYAYTFLGKADKPPKITGKLYSSFPSSTGKYMRIKVDGYQTMVVDISGADSFEKVAEKINAAFQSESKKRIKIAEVKTVGTQSQLMLTSSIQDDSGRLILMNSLKDEDAIPILLGNESDITTVTGEKQTYFHIPADKPYRATLESVSSKLVSNYAGNISDAKKSLRFTVDNQTKEIEGSEITAATDINTKIEAFFGVLSGKSELNHRLITDKSGNIDFVSFVTGSDTFLRFSIPLKGSAPGQEIDIHEEILEEETVKAYRAIFGDVTGVFDSPAKDFKAPNYTYFFGLPNNNPAKTTTALPLEGGNQDRTSETNLKDLTIGISSNPKEIRGLRLLDKLTDISILVIPGWEKMTEATALAFVADGTLYCDQVRPAQARPLRDLFFVTNTSQDVTDPSAAKEFVQGKITYKSSGGYAALYYPWIEVNDPIGTSSPTILMPPAGSIAGLYASIDGRRGVWKAPAGTEAGVGGIVKLADQVSDVKQDILNPFGVNAIRKMPGAGIVSWGARTLYTNPEWKYIPVRRTAIMMEVSIYEGIQWAVFEPNDEPLWSLLRLNIGAFMMNLFRSGAFQGSTPDEAFFVKCDKETTTQVDIDLGKVNILVGFAPLKPAEFVIVKISQKAGQKE